MAKYWRGGTGNWSNPFGWSSSPTTFVSTTVPTAADDVIFDLTSGASSTIVVTLDVIAYAKSINFTGFKGTFKNSTTTTYTLNISGSLILSSGMTYSNSGNINLLGTSGSTLTSSGKSFGGNLYFGSSSIECSYTCTDAIVVLGSTYIDRGTVYFNGGSTNIPDGPISKTQYETGITIDGITYGPYIPSLKTSTIYVGRYNVSKTLIANSIELTGITTSGGDGVWAAGSYGGPTNLNITGLNKLFVTGNTTDSTQYKLINAGGNTFKDYYVLTTGPGLAGTRLTTNGTFDNIYFASSSINMRLRGCTINKSLDFTYSTGSWDQGTTTDTVFNLKGNLTLSAEPSFTIVNSPILTFNNPDPNSTSYITCNGKTLTDEVVVDGAASVICYDWFRSTKSITVKSTTVGLYGVVSFYDNVNCKNLTVLSTGLIISYSSNIITLSGTLTISPFSTTFGNDIYATLSAASIVVTDGEIRFNNPVTVTSAINVNNATASLVFKNILTSSSSITLTLGKLVIEKDITATSFSVSGTGSKILNFNSNYSSPVTITLTGSGTPWGFGSNTGLSVNYLNNTIIKFTNTSTSSSSTVTFDGGNLSYGTVWWNRIGTTASNIVKGSNSYKAFKDGVTYNSDGVLTNYGILAHTIQFEANSTSTFESFFVNASSGTTITLETSSTANPKITYVFQKSGSLVSGAVRCYNLIINHCVTPVYSGNNIFWAFSSRDLGGPDYTQGWKFINRKYWIGKVDNNWNNSQNWSAISTDTYDNCSGCGAGVPAVFDDAVFSSNSNIDCVINVTAYCKSLTFRGDTNNLNYAGKLSGTSNLSIVGGMVLSPDMTYSYLGNITFTDETNTTDTPGSYSITSNNIPIISDLIFTGVYDSSNPQGASKWTFTDFVKLPSTSITSNTTLTLNKGSIIFSGIGPTDPTTGVKYNASIGMFYSSGITTLRSITANNIEITGSNSLGGLSYPWDATTAGITVNVNNIYVTSTYTGRRYVIGNTTNAALKNVWFYGPATASTNRFADYTGLGGGSTKVDNVYVRGNLASSTGTQTYMLFNASIIGNLDFGTSTVNLYWAAANTITLTGNLILSPNMLLEAPPAINFTNTTNGVINTNGCTAEYLNTISISAANNAITVNIPNDLKIKALVLNSGNLTLGSPNDTVGRTLQFTTFNINGGDFITQTNSTIKTKLTTSGGLYLYSSGPSSTGININASIPQIANLQISSGGILRLNNTTTINDTTNLIEGYLYTNGVFNSGAIFIGTGTTTGYMSIDKKLTVSGNITLFKGEFIFSYNDPSETVYHGKCSRFISNTGLGRTIELSPGLIFEITGTTANPYSTPGWDLSNSNNLKLNASGSTIKLTGTNSTSSNSYTSFNGGSNLTYTSANYVVTSVQKDNNINYGNLIFKSNVPRNEFIFGNNCFEDFEDISQTGTHILYFQQDSVNCFNTFSVNGTPTYRTTINTTNYTGSGASTQYHYLFLTGSNNVFCKYLNIKHSSASSISNNAYKWLASLSIDTGGDLPTIGWILTNNLYWVGRGSLNTTNNTKSWNDLKNWSTTSGGPNDVTELPTSIKGVIFDNHPNIPADGKAVFINNNAQCLDFDCIDFTGTFLMDGYGTSERYFSVYGNFIIGSSFTTFPSGSNAILSPDPSYVALYSNTSTNFINTNGNSLKCNIQLNGNILGSTLLDNHLATTGYIKFRSGVFSTSPDNGTTSYNITCSRFLNYENYQSIIYLNNSTITLIGNNTYTYPSMTVAALGTGVASVWSLQGSGTGSSGTGSNITLYAGTSEIIMNNTTNTTVTFTGGGSNKVYNNITFNRDGSTADNLISINAPAGSPKITFNEIKDLGLVSHNLKFTTSTGGVYMYNLNIPNTSPTNRITLDSSNGINLSYLFSNNANVIDVNYATVNRIVAQPCKFKTTSGYIQGPSTTGWGTCVGVNKLLPITGVGQ